MSENIKRKNKPQIGKKFKTGGEIISVLGVIGFLFLSVYLDTDTPLLFVIGGATSVITGMLFVGIGEIINLLQENVDQNNVIIDSGLREVIDLLHDNKNGNAQ